MGTSLVVQWLSICTPNAEGPSLIPDQGTRSRMPQLRVRMLQLKILHATTKIPQATTKIPHAATKTRHNQINK